MCIGTGPSLTPQQIECARGKGFALTGCNNTWEMIPDLRVLYACNEGWWAHYWSDALAAHPCEKWTTNAAAAKRYGVNWIAERDGRGLSDGPHIHHGHGSGYSLLNLVYLMGARRVVLLGYDMKYAPDYDGRRRDVGSKPRHYFGEYPESLLHWPKAQVRAGVHVGLVQRYREVAEQGRIEILNATPDSALDCFPRVPIDAL